MSAWSLDSDINIIEWNKIGVTQKWDSPTGNTCCLLPLLWATPCLTSLQPTVTQYLIISIQYRRFFWITEPCLNKPKKAQSWQWPSALFTKRWQMTMSSNYRSSTNKHSSPHNHHFSSLTSKNPDIMTTWGFFFSWGNFTHTSSKLCVNTTSILWNCFWLNNSLQMEN